MQAPVSNLDIVTYYDQCEIDYKWLWHLDQVNAMHYGLWHEGTSKLRVALQNMNEFVTSKLDIKDGHKILDAGCGVGGTAQFVAKKYNVDVEGITLSDHQVQKATKSAEEKKFKGKVKFSAQDFCNTSFPDNNFDGIYAIESVCHANEKEDFLRESKRILKDGGTLTVAGFFATSNIKTEKDKKLMSDWADSWAVPAYEHYDSFVEKAEKVGLKVEENNNITNDIKKSAFRLYLMFFPGIVFHTIFRMLFIRNKVQGKNVWSTYYQYSSLKKGLWEYRVFKFTK